MKERDIIAVDGPAASGKSVCAEVARKLGYAYLETGAIYRMLTLFVLRSQVDPRDADAVTKLVTCNFGRLSFWNDHLTFDGQMVRDEIRVPGVSGDVHHVAKIPAVRKLVVPFQRSFGEETRTHVIVEGRDIGSVVFPEARVKIFLTADLEVRAKRRWIQYSENRPTYTGTLAGVQEGLRERDLEDTTRPDSPLKQLPEAVFIDSTFLSKEEVIERMLAACQGNVFWI